MYIDETITKVKTKKKKVTIWIYLLSGNLMRVMSQFFR